MRAPMLKEMMDEVIEMQMAPLIDCVFQLLIYFMVATSLHRTEADLGISLPGTIIQSGPVQMPDETIVEVDAKGAITLNARVFQADPDGELPELVSTLRRYKQAAEAAKTKALVTVIAADTTIHQRVIDVMNACAAAGIRNVSIGMGEQP